jgi:hypothetical protein
VFYHAALAEKLANSDLNGGANEIFCQFNSQTNWYFGTDGLCPNNRFDFVTIVLHELAHGLGFSGGCSFDNTIQALTCNAQPNTYDRHLGDASGVLPVPLTPTTTQTDNFLTSGNVFWNGGGAVVQNANNLVELYAPNPW